MSSGGIIGSRSCSRAFRAHLIAPSASCVHRREVYEVARFRPGETTTTREGKRRNNNFQRFFSTTLFNDSLVSGTLHTAVALKRRIATTSRVCQNASTPPPLETLHFTYLRLYHIPGVLALSLILPCTFPARWRSQTSGVTYYKSRSYSPSATRPAFFYRALGSALDHRSSIVPFARLFSSNFLLSALTKVGIKEPHTQYMVRFEPTSSSQLGRLRGYVLLIWSTQICYKIDHRG